MRETKQLCSMRSSWRHQRQREIFRSLRVSSNEDPDGAYLREVEATTKKLGSQLAELQKSMPVDQALQKCTQMLSSSLEEICTRAVRERDARMMRFLKVRGGAAVRAMESVGEWPAFLSCAFSGTSWDNEADSFAKAYETQLGRTLHDRQYRLGMTLKRIISDRDLERAASLPKALELPGQLEHVISKADVEMLRGGGVLVLDPDPALLSAKEMLSAHRDLLERVRTATASKSTCNVGALTAPLLLGNRDGHHDQIGLGAATRTLLRRLAGLPALIERHGWPQRLLVPAMAYLGCYPGNSGARYRPHLDNDPSEEINRREITILLYTNIAWDAARSGGCLRLHPTPGLANEPGTPCAITAPRDVDPRAGRIVIFGSRTQLHEVLPVAGDGVQRLALTLWLSSPTP